MYAVIKTGGKQYRVAPGDTIRIERVDGKVGEKVNFGSVLAVHTDEKKVVVGPNVPIVRYEVGDKSELKAGAAISVVAATKKPDGTFSAARINVGRNGVVPN